MRLLIRLHHAAEPDLGPARFGGGNIPILSGQIVRRLAGPQCDDMIDRLGEHGVTIGIEQLQRFHVGAQHAGANAEHQAAFQQVVDHRCLGGDQERMAERQIRNRRAEPYLRREAGKRGDEGQAVGNVFGKIGQVLAAIALAKAQPVGEDKRLAVFTQRLCIIPRERMNGHDEETELHIFLRNAENARGRRSCARGYAILRRGQIIM